jgi:5S rRNA maturation endonuclease (ribonuclease M5)
MRAPTEVRLERFQKLMERVSYESEKGGVIVVEGHRDRDSLRKMGIGGPILCLQSSRKNTVGFAEELDGVRDVIVLTDFDREGVSLAKRLFRVLSSRGVRTNLLLWRDLRRVTRSDVRSIEELPKFYQRLQNKRSLGFPLLDRGYEVPLLSNQRRAVDYRRIRLSKEHKYRKKTRKAIMETR